MSLEREIRIFENTLTELRQWTRRILGGKAVKMKKKISGPKSMKRRMAGRKAWRHGGKQKFRRSLRKRKFSMKRRMARHLKPIHRPGARR